MICYCPFCANELPEVLVDGAIFCPKCSRIILSSKENEYLAAYRIIKQKRYTNQDQLKQHLRISKKELDDLIEIYENQNYSAEEFEKKLKAGAITI